MPDLLVSTNFVLTIVLLILIIAWIVYSVINHIRVHKIAKFISQKQFVKGKRRAQIVDLRERKAFNAGHILGARNIPFSTFRTFYNGIRSDMPVYLYDQSTALSSRAAVYLYKKGYRKLYILKEGYRNWTGKTKKRDV
ncbi:rhodanese-like domain-containing protein [Acetilactobacillus jinshanensis]|uniref:Rhodanese-like domain-containing protein n=1 Tax=Acetilactobacillus jinshanensis TaxID=1720083 RepID=A0A4P6ZLG2_9LACO|nr:rhodanese-like domain-containing protein [Acetilactobacillus jinshanensis]QBP18646.1 rhodanese-like domain-containing protein [Acetilactobacillus jinshanensis]URL61522.1 rhodanese-like domain-containing protein [uncultured bacterium]